MGKKAKPAAGGGLGNAIIRDRFANRNGQRQGGDSMLHTSELNDGYDWGRLNLTSVTEQSSLEEFLTTAELAGTEFTAERMNITFVNPKVGEGLPTADETERILQLQRDNKTSLRIPRRPPWDSDTTAEELQQRERASFLEWRRMLKEVEEIDGLVLTPFEKNLEFWRQLWRVVERSDVVVQIVDARNPILFRCEDLEKYVQESGKVNMLLINKADLLTQSQLELWSEFFTSVGITTAFFSALASEELTEEESDEKSHSLDVKTNLPQNRLLGRGELLNKFRSVGHVNKNGMLTVGLVGYPNVGKSSTINALLTYKKVPVSATPGKTKHFQTLLVEPTLCLCDCPGLVMPSFVATKADLVVGGILPIDQMRDHVPPINFVVSVIPRHILETSYSIVIPPPPEGEDPNRLPIAQEFLDAYGYMRGFMTQRGLPDHARAARYILKDYVNGSLLFCHAPPGILQETFHQFSANSGERTHRNFTPQQQKIAKATETNICNLDEAFFQQVTVQPHSRGIQAVGGSTRRVVDLKKAVNDDHESKPWKKHHNKNKREKLRRVHAALDN